MSTPDCSLACRLLTIFGTINSVEHLEQRFMSSGFGRISYDKTVGMKEKEKEKIIFSKQTHPSYALIT